MKTLSKNNTDCRVFLCDITAFERHTHISENKNDIPTLTWNDRCSFAANACFWLDTHSQMQMSITLFCWQFCDYLETPTGSKMIYFCV